MSVAQENRWKRKCISDFNEINDRQIEREAFAMPRQPRAHVAPPVANPTRREVRAWMRLNRAGYETATHLAEAANIVFNMPQCWLDDPDHWVWEEAIMCLPAD